MSAAVAASLRNSPASTRYLRGSRPLFIVAPPVHGFLILASARRSIPTIFVDPGFLGERRASYLNPSCLTASSAYYLKVITPGQVRGPHLPADRGGIQPAALAHRRHNVFGAGADAGRPARCHCLEPRVKAHALGTVDGHVAEQ